MAELYDQLTELKKSDFYPFHMPGHKRNMEKHPLKEMFGIDITEIDGFDNLHHPTGILAKLQQEAACMYGAEETFFLVNGSTCGLQAAISASIEGSKKLLMARNCHKAAYHTCYIREMEPLYVYPKKTSQPWIYGSIDPGDVEEQLEADSTIAAVLITSPNYDGVLSDIRTIARIVHEHEAILIVDEAHGAHLPFSSLFPESAIACGADLVIQSLHKTLPSMTQTALLHVQGKRVNRNRLRQFLSIYQTSSPSYVFLSTMQQCIEFTYENRTELFGTLWNRINRFLENTKKLRNLSVLSKEWAILNKVYDFDPCKILVSTSNCILNGEQIYEILLRRYHLQMEMASRDYVLGIATICDSQDGFDRLEQALFEMDSLCDRGWEEICQIYPFLESPIKGGKAGICGGDLLCREEIEKRRVLPIHKACELERESVDLRDARGKISAEFVYLYPPGVPMVVPGERITEELIQTWVQCMELGLPLQGLQDTSCRSIDVIKGHCEKE